MAWRRRRKPEVTQVEEKLTPYVREAEEELRRAEEQLAEVESRDEEVEGRASVLETIHRINHIGPRFFAALELKRREGT